MSDQTTPPDQAALTTPWAADLQAAFPDAEQAAAFDQFLREKVQPHVTKLEQDKAGLAQAKELYDDLQADPGQTYVMLTQELFGEDRANEIVALLTKGDVDGAVDAMTETDAGTPAEPSTQAALPPEDREALDAYKLDLAKQRYNTALDTFIADDHGDVKKNLFHPFVAGAQGDLEQAYSAYKEWLGEAQTEFGTPVTDDGAISPDDVVDEVAAPPTLGGGDAAAVTSPPIAKEYGSLDEAIDDFMAEQKTGPPPTVGSV